MGAGDARYGRRDNGLVAAEYAAAGDVDPRVGEHLLDVLALDGIAAYLRPSSDLHPVTRSASLPDRPTDRLYVDRGHLGTARDLLARLADETTTDHEAVASPEPPRRPRLAEDNEVPSVDDAWAEIVAGFHDEVSGPRRSWPAAEDLPAGDHGSPAPEADPPRRILPNPAAVPTGDPRSAADQPSLLDGLDTFGTDLPDAEDGGYTPPPAPPVPRPSAPATFGVIGIVGGLAVFLRPSLLPFAEGTAIIFGFIAVVAGFATLVWRLRPDDEETDPDDGARV